MTTQNPHDLLLPNELERKQMFHLLKKHSSWTAWNRILGYYQKWAGITEESVRQADNNGLLPKTVYPPDYTAPLGVKSDTGETSILYRDYVDISRGLALFDEGVRRLAKGDKRVFTADETSGLFAMAMRCTIYYFETRSRCEWEEKTPLMKEFFEALDELNAAKVECGLNVLENRYYCYWLWHMVFLPKFPYPDPLPELPKVYEDVKVETGEIVPCSGIWEPMEDSALIGGMGYLHGGRPAPMLQQSFRDKTNQELGYASAFINTTWYLLWRDNRYEDETIPAEEQDYQFLEPDLGESMTGQLYGHPIPYLKQHRLPNPLLNPAR